MSQFIRLTSAQADAVFVCGDMNNEPVDLGYKIITTNADLRDAWIDKVHCVFSSFIHAEVFVSLAASRKQDISTIFLRLKDRSFSIAKQSQNI